MILILEPHEFLPEHVAYLKKYQMAIQLLSTHNREFIVGVKDINSQYLMTNNAHAKAVGMKCSEDMIGLSDGDMLCNDTASLHSQYKIEDQQVIYDMNPEVTYTYLKVHHYADGFKARIIQRIGNSIIF